MSHSTFVGNINEANSKHLKDTLQNSIEYDMFVKNYLKSHTKIPDEILKKTFDNCECDYYFSEQELIDYKIAKKVSSLEEIKNDLN